MEKVFSKKDTNIVKGIAILLMMLHHCFLAEDRFGKYAISFFPFNQETVVLLAKAGKCCVGIFTFLSAYGLTRSYLKQKKEGELLDEDHMDRRFVLRRYFSLLSGFLAVYAVAFLGSCFFTNRTPWSIYCSEGQGPVTFFYHMILDMLGLSRLVGTPALINTWWYMGLALTVIFIFPIVIRLYKKFGGNLIPAYFLLFFALQLKKGDFSRWLFLIPIGIWFADQKILEKCKSWFDSKRSVFFKILVFLGSFAFLILTALFFSHNYETTNYSIVFLDMILTLGVVIWSYVFLSGVPVLSHILEFLGIHSMNVFLIHSFLRGRWCVDHIYSFRHFVCIILVLLGESILISIGIEWVKKHSGYQNWVQSRLNKL